MARGGKRPGAGRKKGNNALLSETIRAELVKRVHKEMAPLLDALLQAAKGLYVEKDVRIGGEWVTRVYLEKPDIQAGKYLLDQAIGRPKETTETEVELKGLVMDI